MLAVPARQRDQGVRARTLRDHCVTSTAPAGPAGLRDAMALPPELGLLSPLTRLTLLVDAEVERIAAAHGIAYADYLVLGVVRRSPGGHGRPTEMCAVLGRTTGGMTLTLDRLE